jgi:hypothetical protein
MDCVLGDEVDRSTEHFGQGIFEIEQIEPKTRPTLQLVEQIDVAVGRSVAASHRAEDRQFGYTESLAGSLQARGVNHLPIHLDDPGDSHGSIVALTDSSKHQLPQNARFSGIGDWHVLGETQNSELLIGVRSGYKVRIEPEKFRAWRILPRLRRRHP